MGSLSVQGGGVSAPVHRDDERDGSQWSVRPYGQRTSPLTRHLPLRRTSIQVYRLSSRSYRVPVDSGMDTRRVTGVKDGSQVHCVNEDSTSVSSRMGMKSGG